ncbi:hypothetical protein K6U06_22210 [Acidiferrimicrobium sp. IK]|uniref:hypothetical protein n=1 Tax=Acidiferrimicrobium sp. IK TaxID=2871700 RepID=UPI0021CB8D59|nr:hypothetical protein [Acidiferrimicrobium sp. IK]MCU4187092.1 hypothetical protein [Acidiferrimicrobium sp. IK]
MSNELTGFGEQPEDRLDLDLATTALLAKEEDLPMLLKMLAGQLQVSLSDRLTVEKEGGLFKKSDNIKSIEVAMGSDTFRAEVVKGRVTCSVGHTSGGIRIRSEQVGIDEWIKRLLDGLRAEAEHSQRARQTLENIVYGGYA